MNRLPLRVEETLLRSTPVGTARTLSRKYILAAMPYMDEDMCQAAAAVNKRQSMTDS